MLRRHLKRVKKAYRIMWRGSVVLSLMGVGMVAIVTHLEAEMGCKSDLLFPALAVVIAGIVLIAITGSKEMDAELDLMERQELINAWYERTSNG